MLLVFVVGMLAGAELHRLVKARWPVRAGVGAYLRTKVATALEEPKVEPCLTCKGRRECQYCDGDGLVHGTRCFPCNGTGDCGVCGGSGREPAD